MIYEILITVFVISLFIYYIVYHLLRKPKNFPPGPFKWIIFGNLLQVGVESYKTVMALRKKYGDIIGIQLGSRRAVYINEYKLLKEAFNIPAFSGRCEMKHFSDLDTGVPRGIATNSGKIWAEQRKFAFSYIQRELRNGRAMESEVMEEISEIIKALKEKGGTPVDTKHVFNIPTINALWAIVAGKKYSLDDAEFMEMIKRNTAVFRSKMTQGFLVFYPRFAKTFPKLTGYQKFCDNLRHIYKFMQNIIDYHKKTYEERQERDLIDAYLHKIKITNDPNFSFYGKTGEKNLLYVVRDLFMGGTETVSTTLSWIVFFMAYYPQIQLKLIDHAKLHLGRPISLKDRPSLPFLEAVINEVLRFSVEFPVSLIHETLEDVDFHGYRLPKGTVVVPNHYAIMHDPEVWGDPQNFRPERFLNEDGSKLIRHESLIPFGIGPRICPGESFARDQLFLFTARLFQNFRVEFDPSLPHPPLDYKLGHILSPVDHKIIFHELANCDQAK